MVIELRMNHSTELVYNSAFHNAFRLQVSLSVDCDLITSLPHV